MLDRSWLARTHEEPIELGFPIVDAHHHLWPDNPLLPGDQPSSDNTARRYGLDDLREDSDQNGISESIFVECGAAYRSDDPRYLRSLGETEWAAAEAARSRSTPGVEIVALVAHVDLSRGAAAGEVLDAHANAAQGLLRGVRHSAARSSESAVPRSRIDPPYGLHSQAGFRAGARALADRGLVFDAWQYHLQLVDLIPFAEHLDDLTIVVDHLGGPLGVGRFASARDEVWDLLRAQLRKLAALENVSMKLSGVGMLRLGNMAEATGEPPSSDLVVAQWGKLLEFVIELFGPQRCMFASNYPVDGETVSATVLWNAYKKVAAKYSDAEQRSLFAQTARSVYRL